ncbi:MAG: NfeD family protein [Pseudomonadota bacterium]|nr:NfeD family protein [Pseudomonadota bacterium]
MEVSAATGWWIVAGLAVAAELATGTFYLLMIALGLGAAAIAASLGLALALQLVVAAAVGGGATLVWHWHRRARGDGAAVAARQNRDVNLDIGEHVHVDAWAGDRTARVQHRGSSWGARLEPGAVPQAGEHTVSAVEGNWLVLSPRAPQSPHPQSAH